jgi:hypothetical protein
MNVAELIESNAELPLLTPTQVAEYLNVCTHTLTRYKKAGLKRIALNPRMIRFRPCDVKAFVDQARVTPPTPATAP